MGIRGGTDGVHISYKGVSCPNLGTGGHNFHSVYEYIYVEDMKKTTQLLIELVRQFAKSNYDSRNVLEIKKDYRNYYIFLLLDLCKKSRKSILRIAMIEKDLCK